MGVVRLVVTWSLACLTAAAPAVGQPAASVAPSSESVVRDARADIAAGRRAEALAALDAHLAHSPRDVDARLLYGLALSWSGRYDDARAELERVLDQAPGYADARVALANVEWWSGQYERLQAVATEGLRQQPDQSRWLLYQARALDGLGQARQARVVVDRVLARDPGDVGARALGERLDARLRPWSAQVSHTVDRFDDGREPWKETAATLGRVTAVGTILARASHAERFGLSDTQFEIEAYPRLRSGTYGYVNIGGSVDQTLYPRARVGVELYQSLGHGVEVSAGFRRLAFASTTHIYVGTLTKYLGNWMVTTRVYHVPAEPYDSTSYHGLVRRYFGADGTSFLGVGYGHGFARDEIRNLGDLVTLDSDTVRVELDARLGARLRAAASGGTSRQQRATGRLRQHTLSASLRLLF